MSAWWVCARCGLRTAGREEREARPAAGFCPIGSGELGHLWSGADSSGEHAEAVLEDAERWSKTVSDLIAPRVPDDRIPSVRTKLLVGRSLEVAIKSVLLEAGLPGGETMPVVGVTENPHAVDDSAEDEEPAPAAPPAAPSSPVVLVHVGDAPAQAPKKRGRPPKERGAEVPPVVASIVPKPGESMTEKQRAAMQAVMALLSDAEAGKVDVAELAAGLAEEFWEAGHMPGERRGPRAPETVALYAISHITAAVWGFRAAEVGTRSDGHERRSLRRLVAMVLALAQTLGVDPADVLRAEVDE